MSDDAWEIWFQSWPDDNYDEDFRARVEQQLATADCNGSTAFQEVEVTLHGDEGAQSLRARVVWDDADPFEAFDFPRWIVEDEIHKLTGLEGGEWCAQFRVRHFDLVLDERERSQEIAAARRDL